MRINKHMDGHNVFDNTHVHKKFELNITLILTLDISIYREQQTLLSTSQTQS